MITDACDDISHKIISMKLHEIQTYNIQPNDKFNI